MGHPLWTLADTRQRVRRALREAFPDMFGDRWEEARDVFYDRFREIHLERLEVCSGAESLLKLFQERGVYLGVVSNKSGDHLRREAEYLGWEGYFSRLVGATDAEKDKPALDPVLMALKPGELAPGRNIWFVGDTKIDMECAHIANCIPVLVAGIACGPCGFRGFYASLPVFFPRKSRGPCLPVITGHINIRVYMCPDGLTRSGGPIKRQRRKCQTITRTRISRMFF